MAYGNSGVIVALSLDVYQNFRDTYKSFPSMQSRESRNAVFSALARLYTTEEMRDTAFETGVYYRLAQEVKDGKIFKDHPESLDLLRGKASTYQKTFQKITTDAGKSPSPPMDLKKVLSDLRRAHIFFMNAYIDELERVYPDSSDVVSVKYGDVIQLFVGAISNDIERHKQDIIDEEPLLFTQMPKLAIEKLFREQIKIPELFEPQQALLIRARGLFIGLSGAEKETLHLKLLGEAADLTPAADTLFKLIEEISYKLQRGDGAVAMNLVFRETVAQLKKGF